MTESVPGINPDVAPSGAGCVECDATGGWWFHLRRCADCGHVGCCDSSPSQHASAHAATADHPWIQSFEPGEDWFYSYATEEMYNGPELAPPTAHPADQPTPGPAGRVPADWMRHLN
ncbi:ubiquitin-hydrolase Zn-finger-containing protein [Nakamurella panacisegetis]|uniref:Ubiquitin-hydrolase Zn-finger-containing protein n=1 Tax=Nakamurella panacisegetis TaxID=1090615 RepID=A0A1H0MGX0_9ACTN|nr:UBP-type zinc finger domain-containing protein [Nakamurella panacisegetis]SDO79689.1 ubiquitin-hydrolase Zn-finger-containing protein [Nakamurella panacisegetis]